MSAYSCPAVGEVFEWITHYFKGFLNFIHWFVLWSITHLLKFCPSLRITNNGDQPYDRYMRIRPMIMRYTHNCRFWKLFFFLHHSQYDYRIWELCSTISFLEILFISTVPRVRTTDNKVREKIQRIQMYIYIIYTLCGAAIAMGCCSWQRRRWSFFLIIIHWRRFRDEAF